MELLELMRTRRSVRSYKDDAVSEENDDLPEFMKVEEE